MLETKTAESHQPPMSPPKTAVAFEGDDIEELGERLAALSLNQAADLLAYLRRRLGGSCT